MYILAMFIAPSLNDYKHRHVKERKHLNTFRSGV